MLDVLAHADLPHQLVLVAVHSRQLPHMSKRVLDPVCQLEKEHNKQPLSAFLSYSVTNTQLRSASLVFTHSQYYTDIH